MSARPSPLSGKKVIVVGGSSGIGFAVAKLALEEGATVIVSSSKQAKVDAAVQRLKSDKVSSHAFDATDEQAIKAFCEQIGKFDHLVLTLGPPLVTGFPDVDLTSAKVVMESRLWSGLAFAKYTKTLISSTGSITLTSGILGERPLPGYTVLAAANGVTFAAARGLAIDLAPVRVNCIAPGLVDTEIWDGMPAEVKAGMMQGMAARLPLKRVAGPESIAEGYIFLMRCDYMTGQTLYIDGGALIGS